MSELHNAIVEVVHEELTKTTTVLEERIRAIVREELAAWEKTHIQVAVVGRSDLWQTATAGTAGWPMNTTIEMK